MENPRIRIYFRSNGDLLYRLLNRPELGDMFYAWVYNMRPIEPFTIELIKPELL